MRRTPKPVDPATSHVDSADVGMDANKDTPPRGFLRMFFGKDRLLEVLSVDKRSLALFRVFLGCVLLADWAARLADFGPHYTPEGVLPNSLAMTFAEPCSFSLFFLSDSAWWAALLFAAGGLSLLCFTLGYKTLPATIAAWLFIVSLHNRNALVTDIGDTLVRTLLFWAIFLDTAEVFSVDALARAAAANPRHTRIEPQLRWPSQSISLSSTAVVFQVFIVYFSLSRLQTGEEWNSGNALYYILSLDHLATRTGTALLTAPALLPALTYLWTWSELIAAVLLVVPILNSPCRFVACLVIFTYHACLGSVVHMPLFNLAGVACSLLVLPECFWEDILPSISTTYSQAVLPRQRAAHAATTKRPISLGKRRPPFTFVYTCSAPGADITVATAREALPRLTALALQTFLCLSHVPVAPVCAPGTCDANAGGMSAAATATNLEEGVEEPGPGHSVCAQLHAAGACVGVMDAQQGVHVNLRLCLFLLRTSPLLALPSVLLVLPGVERLVMFVYSHTDGLGRHVQLLLLLLTWCELAISRPATHASSLATLTRVVAPQFADKAAQYLPRIGHAAHTVAFGALLCSVVWSAACTTHVLPDAAMPASCAAAQPHVLSALMLTQSWELFAPDPPKMDGWFMVRGRLGNGKHVDVWNDGGPATEDKPANVAATFRNERWRAYLMRLYEGDCGFEAARLFAAYICRHWNQPSWRNSHYELRQMFVTFVREQTLANFKVKAPAPFVVIEYYC